MNKREEMIELLAKGLNYNLRYDTLADNEIEIEKVTYHTKGLGYAFTDERESKTVTRKEFIDKYRHEGWEVK